jgi:fused signal recognition particle receptor
MLFNRWFKLDKGTEKAREGIFARIASVFETSRPIDDDLWDELEELLLQADVGVQTTDQLLEILRNEVTLGNAQNSKDLYRVLQEELTHSLAEVAPTSPEEMLAPDGELGVLLVVGVNGVGKTTSIAKLASYFKNELGKQIMLAAGDTFRAAAIDQLKIWGERIGVPVIAQHPGADPASVVYDAVSAARARRVDLLIVDTAGRLHTKVNLMEELRKIRRVLERQSVQHARTLLVLDATTGQNAVLQGQAFKAATGLDGLVIAKLDGTAKGGVVFAIRDQLKIPVKFIGLGETPQDIETFDPQRFVEALFTEKK